MNAFINWLTSRADLTASGLILWSLQALVLIALVRILLSVWKAKPPALRHHIWVFALLAIALLPLAPLIRIRSPQERLKAVAFSYFKPASDAAQDTRLPLGPGPDPVSATIGNSPAFALPATMQRAIPYARQLIFFAWLLGVMTLASRLIRAQFRLNSLYRNAIPGERVAGLVSRTTLRTSQVPIRLSHQVSSPMLYGFFRPAILLPSDILEWTTSDERDAMIDHELAHAERRDPLANLLQTIIQIVFFFHPLVRYAIRQINLERELACDERVLSNGARAQAYAEGILKVAERCLGSHAHQIALFSTRQILERRIEMILNLDRTGITRLRGKQLLIPAAIVIVSAWLLVPANLAKQPPKSANASGTTPSDSQSPESLFAMASQKTDAQTRARIQRQAAELERVHQTDALVQLYSVAVDYQVKISTIDALARLNDIGPLVALARQEKSPELRERLLWRIKHLKEHSESAQIRGWDVTGLEDELEQIPDAPPPPPPPPPPPKKKVVTKTMPPPPPPPPRPAGQASVTDNAPPQKVVDKVVVKKVDVSVKHKGDKKPPPPPPPPPKPNEN